MALQGTTNQLAKDLYDAQVGLRNILSEFVPEDSLPETMKRLEKLIEAWIDWKSGARY